MKNTKKLLGIFLTLVVAVGLVGFFGHFAVAFQYLLFLAVKFGLSEAVLHSTEDFGQDDLGSLLNAVLLGSATTNERIAIAA